jgi:hypothetical protein
MPYGTATNAYVTNTCTAAGERPNKTLIFISRVTQYLPDVVAGGLPKWSLDLT